MKAKQVRKTMNSRVQLKWYSIFILLSLIVGVVAFLLMYLLLKAGFGFSIFIGVAILCIASWFLISDGIEVKNLKIPAGSEAVPYFQGELIENGGSPVILKQMDVPIVTGIKIPIIGRQEMYDAQIMPKKGRVVKRDHTLTDITTKKDGNAQGVQFQVPLDYRYLIHDQVTYAERVRSQASATRGSDTTPEGNFGSVLDTVGKKVSDHFTYNQIDDSLPATQAQGETNPFNGKTFSEAILEEVKGGHGGLNCHCDDDHPNRVIIDELGITIVNILPKSTLSTNDKFLNAREQQAIEVEERAAQTYQFGTVLQVASMLREGKVDGEELFPDGVDNPYENMDADRLNAVVERHLEVREKPDEFILTSDGGGGAMTAAVAAAREIAEAIREGISRD